MTYDYFIPAAISLVSLICYLAVARHSLPPLSTLVLSIVVILIPHISGLFHNYYGTEYEDSYAFQADSKNLDFHDVAADPFRVQIENYDILSGTSELLSYNGHFTTFSAVTGQVNILMGYSPLSTLYLNFVFTLLLALVLCDIVFTCTRSRFYSFLTVLIFSSSAALNVFHTSGLSETFSSLCLAILFALVARIYMLRDSATIWHIVSLLLALSACLLVKRENMAALPIIPFVCYFLDRKYLTAFLVPLLILLAGYWIFVQPISTEFLESNFISAPTFSLQYLLIQLPVYLATFLNPLLFGVAFTGFIATVTVLLYKKSIPDLFSAFVSLVFFAFLFTYCLHYRSQYFISSLEIGPFETFRYANNFFFLLVVSISLNLHKIESTISTSEVYKKWFTTAFVVAYCIGVVATFSLRESLRSEEQFEKIQPAIAILEHFTNTDPAGEISVLVTNIPLVFLMFETDTVRISEYEPESDYNSSNLPNDTYFYFTEQDIFVEKLGNCELASTSEVLSYLKQCRQI